MSLAYFGISSLEEQIFRGGCSLVGDNDPIGPFGDIVWDLSDSCSELFQRLNDLFFSNFRNSEFLKRPQKSSAKAVESEFTVDEDFSPRLKVTKGVEDHGFEIDGFGWFFEEFWLHFG